MEYYQSRTPQYSVSSSSQATGQPTTGQSAYSNMYGTSNSSMYYQQPSANMQQAYGTPTQHYSSSTMGTAQTHGQQPTHTHATHASHWNNGSSSYGVQQQTTGQTHTAPRRTPQQTSYSYRSGAQTQQDATPAMTGMTRQQQMTMPAPAPIPQQQQELPLRMVVEAKYVGAIIGQSGNNIREITKESKARCVVDTQRIVRDNQGNIEKIISITGTPENCSKACHKILEVVYREMDKDPQQQKESEEKIELKLRAHNQLVGRLIGKHGITIKKIMQDTNTTIAVSNSDPAGPVPSMPAMYGGMGGDIMSLERTITVRGPTIQDVSSAEQKISAKLRQSYETDIQNRVGMGYPGIGMPGMPIMPGMNPIGDAYAALAQSVGMRPMGPASNQSKIVRLFVPDNMVGAIIGTKGANIRNIMRNSGAHIKIEGEMKKEKEEGESEEHEHVEEEKKEEKEEDDLRMVTITGSDQQQYKAQCFIFQKIAEQTDHYFEDVKLRSEIQVPSALVGRIIGKGGQNVRELQRVTGAQVKIPDEAEEGASKTPEEKERREPSADETTAVRIVGGFQQVQSAQFRVSALCAEFQKMNAGGGDRRDRREKDDKGATSPSGSH